MVKLKNMAALWTLVGRLHSFVMALRGVKASFTAMVSCALWADSSSLM